MSPFLWVTRRRLFLTGVFYDGIIGRAGYQLNLSIDETRCVLQVEPSYAAPEIGKRRVGSSYKTPGKRLSQWTVSTRKLISRASSALTHRERERHSLQAYIGIFRWLGIDTLRVESVAHRILRMSQYIFSLVLVFLAAQGESFFFFSFCFFGFSFVSIFSYPAPEVSKNWLIHNWLCRIIFMLICVYRHWIYKHI